MTQYAKIENRTAALSSDFGLDFARRVFGDAVVDALPKVTRGKHKGAVAGDICWKKCTVGGWRNETGKSGVVRPGTFDVRMRVGGAVYLDPRAWMASDCYARWVELGRPIWRHDEPISDMEGRWGVTAARREKARADFEAHSGAAA